MAEQEYDSRLFQIGVLWESTSRVTGKPIWSGEIGNGLNDPRDVLIYENPNPNRSENSPTHIIAIRVPLRVSQAEGQGNSRAASNGASRRSRGGDDLDR